MIKEGDSMAKVRYNNGPKKGFTLIEVILSIAILAIISLSFLTMFTNGTIGIAGAGKKSVSHYNAQNKIESNISDSSILSDSAVTNTPSVRINLNFSGKPYSAIGRKVDVLYIYGSKSKKLTTFTTD